MEAPAYLRTSGYAPKTSKNVNDDDFRIRYISNSRGDKAVSSKRIIRCVHISWIKMKKYSD